MRENMKKNMSASEETIITNARNTPTCFGEIYLHEGTLVKVSYKTTAGNAVVTFLEGEDKGKVGTINLNNAKLIEKGNK
jgi:hypothetical protein